ncbi:MAG: acyl-CoA dehydrogenase family protein [Planctomycetota bacterium]|nr:acyl-CoA dehydrogenase family protein [Planctomycetota bacterium]
MTSHEDATDTAPATQPQDSTAAKALAAAGDAESARDVSALDASAQQAARRLGRLRRSLVERLIYGPAPTIEELQGGAAGSQRLAQSGVRGTAAVEAAIDCMSRGEAFTTDGKLSDALRKAVAAEQAYGFTVPADFGGLGASYTELALAEERLAANGLGALAVEISGELTIGAGSLLAYGTETQKRTFLPMIAEGQLMAFGLTEVGVGVNAKRVQAYVEPDPDSDGFRLFAEGDRNKLWITNATHGALVGLVARVGKGGKKVGLFVTRLPERDIARDEQNDYEFRLTPSGADAFQPNWNSRIHCSNLPIPKEGQIEADGVEVLFYCLRMGRCMLAAMAAGYQRMFAADAAHYARQREGVGGRIIKHELPRLALGKMLGGALQSHALSHLSLEQDKNGVDLAGLRDLTKSAAATTALESLIACERVLGGRSFDVGARVNAARSNMHVFGVVEGEDDLILMGMVKDVTGPFTDRYMADMLGVIQSINLGEDGKPLPADQRLLRLTPATLFEQPKRLMQATLRLLGKPSFWRLKGWIVGNLVYDLVRLPGRLLPTNWIPRYQLLPRGLRKQARTAERQLRNLRWAYLGINLWFQLELTRAQIPLQRLGKAIEHLVSVVTLCNHARLQDPSQQRIAALQCETLLARAQSIRILRGLVEMERLRRQVAAVGKDIEDQTCTLLDGIEPQAYAHPFEIKPSRR